MKSFPGKHEAAAQYAALALDTAPLMNGEPQALADARWDWRSVRRVLVVRLRSIGDTVLSTPALYALRRFLPSARIDILLEDWVAPVLEGCTDVDNVLTIERGSTVARARLARTLRTTGYDVAYNLHGGTTATLLMRAAGVRHRVGYANYQYSGLLNHAAPPATIIWQQEKTHSVEQQLALLGWTGVPVTDRPPTRLTLTEEAGVSVRRRLAACGFDETTPLALLHPAAAFESKQWAAVNFARVVEVLGARALRVVAIAAPNQASLLAALQAECAATRIETFTDLSLQEVAALAARASIFVGNDSGIAHIAAAVRTPSVVIFGSSNVAHWRPWTTSPAEVVREEMPCAPCPGYTCAEFEQPECIRRVPVERVKAAIERILSQAEFKGRRIVD
jgi:lipopolysaccharide heptosyltransferase II